MIDFSNSKNEDDIEQDSYESLIFPSDFEGHIYPECIKFGIYEREGVSLEDVSTAIEAGATHFTKRLKQEGELGALETQQQEMDDHPDQFTIEQKQALSNSLGNNNGTGANGRAIIKESIKVAADTGIVDKLKSGIALRKGLATKLKRNIFLNMPEVISFNEAATWEGTNMGVVGAMMDGKWEGAAASMVSGGFGQLATAAGAGIGSMAGKILKKGGMGGLIGGLAGFAGSGSVGDKFESITNTKSNPYKEQTFQGIDFRNFSFSFKFQARNGSELIVIRDIIQSFRAFSKPSFGGDESATGMFKYPHEFQIEFLTLSSNGDLITNEWIPELKYCICKNVKTDFGEGTWKSFQGGHPVEISLSLEFTETELITEEDVFGDTAVGRFKGKGRNF
jgi:hypothetical protein